MTSRNCTFDQAFCTIEGYKLDVQYHKKAGRPWLVLQNFSAVASDNGNLYEGYGDTLRSAVMQWSINAKLPILGCPK